MNVTTCRFNLEDFESQLKGEFNTEIPPHLFTNEYLVLPLSILHQVQSFVDAYYSYVENTPIDLQSLYNGEKLADNSSILMSYDFHLNHDSLKLIEINTNASGAALMHRLNQYLNIDEAQYYGSSFYDELIRSIKAELAAVPQCSRKENRFVITDENLTEQRMYLEFLIYNKFFNEYGWKSKIKDASKLSWDEKKNELIDDQNESYNFVYNRTTDFYLKTNPSLLKAYLSQKVCISPNPKEYHRFANKERLIEASQDNLLDPAIKKYMLQTYELNDQNKEFLKKEKKKYIFKPKKSYGGKSVYRGKSITSQTFERLFLEKGLAQEYFEPGKILRENFKEEFKFDLRFYAYKNKVQLACARLYQGQVTNFRALGSGMTTIKFVPS